MSKATVERSQVAHSVWVAFFILFVCITCGIAQDQREAVHSASSDNTLRELIFQIRAKAKILEASSGMHNGFQSFVATHKIAPESISYSDYVLVRLLYEASRDAGFWNMHWTITNQEPNSDQIWKQWETVQNPSCVLPTASAECDELSAVYSFLVTRTGVHGMGLFWPTYNHTVAVWVVHPTKGPDIRVVVPTSQIFLDVTDSFDTRKFDHWHQKSVHEYVRRDVPDSFEIPKPLFDFFLRQVDRYAGASDSTLQQIRYLREGVFLKSWTPEQAAQDALRRRSNLHGPTENLSAFLEFRRRYASREALCVTLSFTEALVILKTTLNPPSHP